MLYTGKGDSGETTLFGRKDKVSKSAEVIEALGTVDELNAWLGVCKSEVENKEKGADLVKIISEVQNNLFIIQAELAGAPKTVEESKVKQVEDKIKEIEKVLPPIHSFFLPGGTKLAAKLDYARTVARRAERRVIGQKVGQFSLAYLNRLSSLCYALTRLENQKSGIKEESPHYE